MVDEHGAEDGAQPTPTGTRKPRLGRNVLIVALGALLVGGAGLGLALDTAGASTPVTKAVACGTNTPHLTAQGTAQASGTPDVLTAVFSINASAPSASAALAQDNSEVNEADLALLANGVTKSEVQTTGLSLQPMYTYPHDGTPYISSYAVTNTVTATMHDTAKAGAAIDAVVGANGDAVQINSVGFSFSNPNQVQDQARAAAVRQAVGHAQAMAAASGRKLGPVCSLTDVTPSAPQNVNEFNDSLQATAGTASAPVPLESGSQSETDQVTMVYALESR
jgi:uncharacterized protein